MTDRRDRPAPVNVSAVTRPKWTGAQIELAVGVSRGEPRRTDDQMRVAVREQVADYLLKHPPCTPTASPVNASVLDLLADRLAVELVTPSATSIMVFREHLLLHLGMEHQLQKTRNEERNPA